jgi:hypothetical protein
MCSSLALKAFASHDPALRIRYRHPSIKRHGFSSTTKTPLEANVAPAADATGHSLCAELLLLSNVTVPLRHPWTSVDLLSCRHARFSAPLASLLGVGETTA